MATAAASLRAASEASGHVAGTKAAGVSPPAATPMVFLRHFEAALQTVTPSVNKRDRRSYEAMRTKLRGARAHIPVANLNTSPNGDGALEAGPQDSGADAAAGATAPAGRASNAGDDMEGVDDAAEPEDPMKD
eukprot:GHUV01051344.1.p1 GENE.GHUV01051344.1~~GHUV01051344.1.p1  ORF type:complete len:133 (-),score=45.36 GHUV01051344.1:306-704(-)